MKKAIGFGLAMLGACFASNLPASAQIGSSKVSLYAHWNPAFFGAASGNSCWGFVSQSGKEYAVMGLDNQVAFIDITNPSAPVLKASIPHAANLWGDVKVYGNYVYAVTERTGSGLQVIDISNLDNGQATLVRTIAAPGRSHTLAIDTQSGFLYTCGSREGTGTTTCWSLANPSNPVRVGGTGTHSMTVNSSNQGVYMHEAIAVTYTSGPMAGKQIFFGFSEGRGVDIYDMTNKNAPILIKRATYPNMGYCHQGWLSADRKYLYVDDEFDENNLAVPTRTLIFNVEDPANAVYIGDFTTGVACIDHNQYWHEGFLFQANYTSGLQIFDTAMNPELPTRVGWYDTFGTNDGRQYSGAWSNYPFFPSGTVIVSDIEGGFFALNVLEATTRKMSPVGLTIPVGQYTGGSLANLVSSDDQKYYVSNSIATDDMYPIQVQATTTAYDNQPKRLRVSVESSMVGSSGYRQEIALFDYVANDWVNVDVRVITGIDSSVTTNWLTNPSRFVHPTTREVKAYIKVYPWVVDEFDFTAAFDEIRFDITM